MSDTALKFASLHKKIRLKLRDRLNDATQALKLRLTPAATAIPSRWVKPVTVHPGDKVCLLVTVLRNNQVLPHAIYQAQAWTTAGYKVIAIAVTEQPEDAFSDTSLDFTDGIILRANRGYDFGAWSAVIQSLPMLRKAALLVTTNDSIFGPFDNFGTMLKRVTSSSADMIALTDSHYHRRHFQSYTLFYKSRALRSPIFWSFWKTVRSGNRWAVIVRYETRLLKLFETTGLIGEALFPSADSGPPPTLKGWKPLIERGFPFVKVQLLRDNPFNDDLNNWQQVLQSNGYNPELCRPVLYRRD